MGQPITPTQDFLIFDLAGQSCAVNASEVQEIVHFAALGVPPGMPPCLEGILHLRGASIPVISGRRLFGFENAGPGLYAPLVIIRSAQIALLLDAAVQMLSVDFQLSPIGPGESFMGCAVAAIAQENRTHFVLNVDRLMIEAEQKRGVEFAAIEQRRRKASLPDEAPVEAPDEAAVGAPGNSEP